MTAPAPETEFKGHCSECGHTWTVAYLPMPIAKFAKVAKGARCPKGCDGPVLCGEGGAE